MKKTKQPIRPLANCVLVRRNVNAKRTKESAEWQGQGEVLAVGAGVRELAVGDRVFFRGPGLLVDIEEGRKGLLLRQSDILAINNMPENKVSAVPAKASPRARERTGRRGRAGIAGI